jgi:hypothetical protein
MTVETFVPGLPPEQAACRERAPDEVAAIAGMRLPEVLARLDRLEFIVMRVATDSPGLLPADAHDRVAEMARDLLHRNGALEPVRLTVVPS